MALALWWRDSSKQPDDNLIEASATVWCASKLNRTLALKALLHFLPRLLLVLDPNKVLDRLIERLRAPTAIERTRPDRKAPRKKGVRIAAFHPAYRAA